MTREQQKEHIEKQLNNWWIIKRIEVIIPIRDKNRILVSGCVRNKLFYLWATYHPSSGYIIADYKNIKLDDVIVIRDRINSLDEDSIINNLIEEVLPE